MCSTLVIFLVVYLQKNSVELNHIRLLGTGIPIMQTSKAHALT